MRATTINNYFICRCGSRERKGSAKGLCKRCYAAERWRAQNPDKRRRVPAREGLVSICTLIHWTLNDQLQAIADRHNVTKAVLLNLALLEGARDLGRLEALVHNGTGTPAAASRYVVSQRAQPLWGWMRPLWFRLSRELAGLFF